MVESRELHPVASESLQKSAEFGYFLTKRMCAVLAQRDAARCVRWTFRLVEPQISRATSIGAVVETLASIRCALENPSCEMLPTLDELARGAWICDFDYESAPFYAHRAASRLAWAAMGLIVFVHDCCYHSTYLGGEIAGREQGLGLVVSQCTSALGMTFSESDDGRLMVAQTFTSEMGKPS